MTLDTVHGYEELDEGMSPLTPDAELYPPGEFVYLYAFFRVDKNHHVVNRWLGTYVERGWEVHTFTVSVDGTRHFLLDRPRKPPLASDE